MKAAKVEGQEAAMITGLKARNEADFQQAVRLFTPGMLAVARFYLDHASAEEVVCVFHFGFLRCFLHHIDTSSIRLLRLDNKYLIRTKRKGSDPNLLMWKQWLPHCRSGKLSERPEGSFLTC